MYLARNFGSVTTNYFCLVVAGAKPVVGGIKAEDDIFKETSLGRKGGLIDVVTGGGGYQGNTYVPDGLSY